MNLVIICTLMFLTGIGCFNNTTSNLILHFLKENNSNICYFFVCWPFTDKFRMHKIILQEQLDLKVTFLPLRKQIWKKIKDVKYNKIGLVLDLSCKESNTVLQASSEANKFRSIYSWLMIGEQKMADIDIKKLIDNLLLRMDTQITIALPNHEECQYDLFEIYDPGREADLKINGIGNFDGENFINFQKTTSYYKRRKNMSDVLLKTANTANFSFDNPEKYFNELRQRDIKTFEKYHVNLFLNLRKIHNFSYNTFVTFPWFGNSTTGCDGGISGLLCHKLIDIGSAGAVMRINRVHHYDYLVTSMVFRARFFFRNPGIHKIGAAILKPFSKATWYVTLVFILITSIAVKAAYWVDSRFLNYRIKQSFFTSFGITISILAQQGSSIVPRRLGGRIIFLTVLILSILIYNYYTSSLVSSLLSTSRPALTTIKELYESELRVGIELQPYTITYIIQRSNDYYIQQLNSTKIYQSQPNFFAPKEGLEKVKSGGFAYHTLTTTAYPIISRTFEQEQVCDLAEMDFVPSGYMSIYITKRSPYRELFQISLLMMKQYGIFKREQDVWLAKHPECLSNLKVISVGKTDLFLVYVILLAGISLAILLLLIEVVWFKIKMKKTMVAILD